MKNKTIFFYGILLILIVSLWYMFLYTPRYNGLISSVGTHVFSHRGLGDFAPDNSLSGAVRAIKDGFDGVDVDAQLTQDGQIVIFHDLSIDRLTTGSGKVESKTLKELIQFDLAKKYQPINTINWSDSYVASFEEFVQEITP